MKAGIKLQRLEKKARSSKSRTAKVKLNDNKWLLVMFAFSDTEYADYVFISNGVETNIDYSQARNLLNGGL